LEAADAVVEYVWRLESGVHPFEARGGGGFLIED
jgi:hypothetical protein